MTTVDDDCLGSVLSDVIWILKVFVAAVLRMEKKNVDDSAV